MSFSAPPHGAVTFLSGKVTKAIGAGHNGLANIRLVRLSCACRRARAGANSHILVSAFPARPAAMLGVMRRRRTHFDTAIHGLPFLICSASAVKNARETPALRHLLG